MKKINEKRAAALAMGGTILALLLDQWTKYLATVHLKEKPSVSLIDGILQLHYLENRGAAFGILQNQRWFFLLIGLLILLLTGVMFYRIPLTKRFLPLRVCCVFISAGAIGNMIDRVLHNYVIDFIYIEWINFPVFNVADIYLTVTTLVLLFLILFFYQDQELNQIWENKHNNSL